MTLSHHYYDELEYLFNELLGQLGQTFSAEEVEEVRQYVDVGEYGVALETFVAIVIEEQKYIAAHTLSLIEALASKMGLNELVTPEVRNRVASR